MATQSSIWNRTDSSLSRQGSWLSVRRSERWRSSATRPPWAAAPYPPRGSETTSCPHWSRKTSPTTTAAAAIATPEIGSDHSCPVSNAPRSHFSATIVGSTRTTPGSRSSCSSSSSSPDWFPFSLSSIDWYNTLPVKILQLNLAFW